MTERDDVLKTDDADGVAKYVAAGADVNAKDDRGNTAFDRAQKCGHNDVAALLGRKGK